VNSVIQHTQQLGLDPSIHNDLRKPIYSILYNSNCNIMTLGPTYMYSKLHDKMNTALQRMMS